MDDLRRLTATEEIKRAKTRYRNGFDMRDPLLMRSVLADVIDSSQ